MRVVSVEEGGKVNVSGHVLVVSGCGSLAYLGELCVDALVSSFDLGRAAVLESRHLLPLAMASAFAAPGAQGALAATLTTAAEIYQSAAVPKLSVLQLRSGIVEGRRQAFVQELWTWARSGGVAEIIVLSSCSSHVKADADMAAHTDLRYVFVGGSTPTEAELGVGKAALPLGHGMTEEDLQLGPTREIASIHRFLRGGGVARPLLLQAATAADGEGGAEAKPGFDPPPRSKPPGALALLGLTGEALDLQLTEHLARCALDVVAARLRLETPPALKAPPSWLFEMEAPTLERRLWT